MSHPTRVRGLKQALLRLILCTIVAPHTGAWIETGASVNADAMNDVAPHTGAWIETKDGAIAAGRVYVAPHTGAWIETPAASKIIGLVLSHPTRVRGLKLS